MRKNTWYAVYHQRELDFLARSYQPGYFFMFMGVKPLTEYLPIDGSKPMTGNLDLGGYGIVDLEDSIKWKTADVRIYAYLNSLYVQNKAGTAFRGLSAGSSVYYGSLQVKTALAVTKMVMDTYYGRLSLTNRLRCIPASEPNNPLEGDMYYDSTAKKLKVRSDVGWETITSI